MPAEGWVLAIDRTNWQFGKAHINILVVSVILGEVGHRNSFQPPEAARLPVRGHPHDEGLPDRQAHGRAGGGFRLELPMGAETGGKNGDQTQEAWTPRQERLQAGA